MKSISYCLLLSLFALALCSFSSTSDEIVSYNYLGDAAYDSALAGENATFVQYHTKEKTSDKGTWSEFNKKWHVFDFAQLEQVEEALNNIAD